MNDNHEYDTRPEAETRPIESPVIWTTPKPIAVNPWLLMFALLVVTPICIYVGLLLLTAAGLVTL